MHEQINGDKKHSSYGNSVRYLPLEHDQVCISSGRARMDRLLFNRSSKAFVKNADPVRRTLLIYRLSHMLFEKRSLKSGVID